MTALNRTVAVAQVDQAAVAVAPGGATPAPAPAPQPAAISVFSLIPSEFLGMPLVFWIGSAAMLFVLFLIYLT